MKKLHLHIGTMVQGQFKLKPINVLLVFQVNCPGCFSYAIPLFNKLYKSFQSDRVSFLALSTAFEDFDKNTLKHTEVFINTGEFVGQTKRFMQNRGIYTYPYKLDFPVAMDCIETTLSRLDLAVDAICGLHSEFKFWTIQDQTIQRNKVISYLNRLDKVALTFTLNQLKGTPSILVFDEQYQVLFQSFGHVRYEEMANIIAQFN